MDLLAEQEEHDKESNESGDDEFTEETKGAKFLIKGTTSKEKSHREEPRNEEEIDMTTQRIDAEMNKTERILDKEVQEIQEIHLYTPNVHQNDSSYDEYGFEVKK